MLYILDAIAGDASVILTGYCIQFRCGQHPGCNRGKRRLGFGFATTATTQYNTCNNGGSVTWEGATPKVEGTRKHIC